jgi:hypothetical protein
MNFARLTKSILGFAEMHFINKLIKQQRTRWVIYVLLNIMVHTLASYLRFLHTGNCVFIGLHAANGINRSVGI